MLRVLTLCLGNICRSPVAEALLRRELEAAGVSATVDSAGTGAYHIGKPADQRSREVAQQHGLELSGAARQLAPADFYEQHIILAMDTSNLCDARRLAPANAEAQIMLMRDFDPQGPSQSVSDPYEGGPDSFEVMYATLERSAREFARQAAAGLLPGCPGR